MAHKLTHDDSSCRLIIICGKSPRRQILRVLLPTEWGENAGSFSVSVTGRCDLGYGASDHDPATGLTRDSYCVRRVSTLPLLLGALEVWGRFTCAPRGRIGVHEGNFLIRVAPSRAAKLVPIQAGANSHGPKHDSCQTFFASRESSS
jgi:hypothetical protein